MTFGETLVGLTFNPSGNEKVNKAKKLCAELADLVNDDVNSGPEPNSKLKTILFEQTIGQILNAQMNAVKILTLNG